MSVFRSCLKVAAVGVLLVTQLQSLMAQELPAGYALNVLPGTASGGFYSVAVVHDADDVVYVGGSFHSVYNGTTTQQLPNSDSSVDQGSEQSDSAASAEMVQVDLSRNNIDYSKPWVPGSAGVAYWDKSLKRWFALGGGIASSTGSGSVHAIAAARDGWVYVGGNFKSVAQTDGSIVEVNNIARYRDGQWQSLAEGVSGQVYTLAIAEHADGSHTVYAGGGFVNSGAAETLNYLARWQGDQWQMIGGGVSGPVGALAYSAHHQGLYVGGNFAQVNTAGDGEDHARAAFLTLADGRWQGLLTPPPCTLPAVLCQVDKRSITSFQETRDGEAVYFRGVDGVYRYRWNDAQTESLAGDGHNQLALMTDQQRLITTTSAAPRLKVMDVSSEQRPVPATPLNPGSKELSVLAAAADGVYLGMRPTHINMLAHLYLQDVDGDGVANEQDNCPQHANADQSPSDIDGVGLACVDDYDGDGLINEQDNCPYVHNPLQRDQDGDAEGDACDLDIDGDGVANTLDAFPRMSSAWQDSDGDGIGEGSDNCPNHANNEQLDMDGDGIGDVCDDDMDGDGVPNAEDACPDDPSRWFNRAMPELINGDSAGQGFGQVLVALGDINGDGVGDYAVGSPNFTAQVEVDGKRKKMARAGRVQVFSGIDDSLLFERQGEESGALLGSAIVAADIDGDQQLDLVLGAPGSNKKTGAAWVCLLQQAGAQYQCANEILLTGKERGDLFGSSVAAGDVDGAGQVAVFISAPRAINRDVYGSENYQDIVGYERLNKRVGAVYMFAGASLTQAQTQSKHSLYGNVVNGEFGVSLAWLASSRELLIGAPLANYKRGMVLFWQPATDAYDVWHGSGGRFGQTLAVSKPTELGQYFAIAAPQATVGREFQAGDVCVGQRLNDAVLLSDCVAGDQPGEGFGAAMTFVQPAAEGKLTLAVGSPKAKNDKGKRVGRVQILMLDPVMERYGEVYGQRTGALFGGALAATDMTGDNLDDLLIGAVKQPHPQNKKLKGAGSVHFAVLWWLSNY